MRILQITRSLGSVGGIQRYVDRLSRRLLANDVQTEVIVFDGSNNVADRSYIVHDGAGGLRMQKKVLAAALETFKPDIMLSHQAGSYQLTDWLLENADCRLTEIVHTTLCPGGKLLRRGERVCNHSMGLRCYVDWYRGPCGSQRSPFVALNAISDARRRLEWLRRCDLVFVASAWMRRHCLEEGVDRRRIRLIDIREDIAQEQPPRLPQAVAVVRLLVVGRLVWNKGVQYAINALAVLPSRFHLRVVGTGWYEPALKELTSSLGLEDRVEFVGPLEEDAINTEYRAADVLLVPSIWPEPAGLVVPEARAAGLPVVAFARGGLAEWSTTYGLEGIQLVPRPSIENLARGILKVVAGKFHEPDEERLLDVPADVVSELRQLHEMRDEDD